MRKLDQETIDKITEYCDNERQPLELTIGDNKFFIDEGYDGYRLFINGEAHYIDKDDTLNLSEFCSDEIIKIIGGYQDGNHS